MKYLELLKEMIATPSLSGDEDGTADILFNFLRGQGVAAVNRLHNNVWCLNADFDASRPTILLCSHHDTVRPSASYTRNPYAPTIEDGKLYGLGSNDAGGSVVALTAAFLHFYGAQNLTYNYCLALVGEEECSGANGLSSLLPTLPPIDFAIIGEPTEMKMAIAERGLLVLDCIASGRSGHAAREEGVNAIYKAMQDMAWVATYQFAKISPLFGSVKMTVTVVNAGDAHNVVPDSCTFTIDVRVTEQYSLQEVLDSVSANLSSTVTPRSMRLNPSSISLNHPLTKAGLALGVEYYGSPTTSDAALMGGVPTLKMGPGDSARSHTADEYIFIDELAPAIEQYIKMLTSI